MISTCRHFVRRRQQIIHEALRDQLAFVVIGELLVQRRADAVGDAAHGHAAHDLRIDHGAAVVADDVAHDLGPAEIGVDRDQNRDGIRTTKQGYICTRPSAVGSVPPVGTCIDGLERESRLHACRHAVDSCGTRSDQLVPAAAMFAARRGRRHRRSRVDRALRRNAEIVRGNRRSAWSFSFCAAWNAAPPSMIAMRLPTGVPARQRRRANPAARRGCVSGSISSTSPITVPTRVSWPCPDEVVCMVAVMAPMHVDVDAAGLR